MWIEHVTFVDFVLWSMNRISDSHQGDQGSIHLANFILNLSRICIHNFVKIDSINYKLF